MSADNGVIYLLHGPNLSQLGTRQPDIYGSTTLHDIERHVTAKAEELGFTVTTKQSESEGPLVEAIHEARREAAGIILNAGALTHYGWSLGDALAMFDRPIIEVHISNTQRREPWRHISVVSPKATGVVMGLGLLGYDVAVEAIARATL